MSWKWSLIQGPTDTLKKLPAKCPVDDLPLFILLIIHQFDDSLVDVSVDCPQADGLITDPPDDGQVVEPPVGIFCCWSFNRYPVDGSPVDVL